MWTVAVSINITTRGHLLSLSPTDINKHMHIDNASDDGLLEVHSIDVGQGDATLIIGPEGETTLVDVGPNVEARNLVSENIHRRMEARDDVDGLDNIVITHFDQDHVRGARQMAKAHEVSDVYVPNPETYLPDADPTKTSQIENEALADLDVAGEVTVHSVDTSGGEPSVGRPEEGKHCFDIFTDDNVETSVLNPKPPNKKQDGSTDRSRNSESLAFSIEYNRPEQPGSNPTAVIAGDAPALAAPDDLSDITYATGFHHGSKTSLNALEQVNPQHVNFSCDPPGNTYGLPHTEMTEEVAEEGMNMTATNVHGTTSFVTDGRTETILTQRAQVMDGTQYNGTEIRNRTKDISSNPQPGFATELPVGEPQPERVKPSEVEMPDIDPLIFEEGEKVPPDAYIEEDLDLPDDTRDIDLYPERQEQLDLDHDDDGFFINKEKGKFKTWSESSSSTHPLEEIPGIGPQLARRLDDAGVTIDTAASTEELQEIDGIGPESAENISKWLNNQNEEESTSVEPQTYADEGESQERGINRR